MRLEFKLLTGGNLEQEGSGWPCYFDFVVFNCGYGFEMMLGSGVASSFLKYLRELIPIILQVTWKHSVRNVTNQPPDE